MITGFCIILNDNILYCSNQEKYSLFETILFIEKLIESINPNNIWRLNNVFFKNNGKTERIVIKHIISRDNDIFYCISGQFDTHSEETYNMLEDFHTKVESSYSSIARLTQASEESMFKEMINVSTDLLKIKYESRLKTEEIRHKIANLNQPLTQENKILYCGISTQGLPIISKLFHPEFFDYLKSNKDEDVIEVFGSKLSAKLATIAMNTAIRADTRISEIHLNDLREERSKILILYGNINGYSLDFIGSTSGNEDILYSSFLKLKQDVSEENVLQDEFGGDLAPYRHLKKYLAQLVKDLKK
jgi:hypothetical protein